MNPIINQILSGKSTHFSEFLNLIAVTIILIAHKDIIIVQIIEIIRAKTLLRNEIEVWKVKPQIQIVSVLRRGIDAGIKREIKIKTPPIKGKIQGDFLRLMMVLQLKIKFCA